MGLGDGVRIIFGFCDSRNGRREIRYPVAAAIAGGTAGGTICASSYKRYSGLSATVVVVSKHILEPAKLCVMRIMSDLLSIFRTEPSARQW